jgi:hypothetical protein
VATRAEQDCGDEQQGRRAHEALPRDGIPNVIPVTFADWLLFNSDSCNIAWLT